MARPSVIRDEQILQAAREVFLERGFSATTAEVARRAGVAEGTLFNRFATKRDLFHAAMRPDLEEPSFVAALERRVDEPDVRAVLEEVGLETIAFFRHLVPLIMMSWSNPEGGLPPLLLGPNPPPLRALKRVAAYFEAVMRRGRMKRHDPEIVARALVGALQNYVFFEVLLRAQEELPLDARAYVKGLVGVLCEGVLPPATKVSAHSSKGKRRSKP